MERLLSVSRELRDKVQENESAASELLKQSEELREELKAMRQWREVVPSSEDNHVQLPNIEFKYIKQLQAENAELRTLLEEHQSAIEMIMSKYRQQVGNFMNAEKEEKTLTQDRTEAELLHRTDQLYHMAAVVSVTSRDDDLAAQQTVEYVTQLEYENKHLREILQFSSTMLVESNDRTQPVSRSETAPALGSDATPVSRLDTAPVNSLSLSAGMPSGLGTSVHSHPSSSSSSSSGPIFTNRFPSLSSSPPFSTSQVRDNLQSDDALWKKLGFTKSAKVEEVGETRGGSDKETVIGNSYTDTPINSGQNTPLVGVKGNDLRDGPLLELARDRLTDTVT